MKNITIVVDEDVARWARIWAAEEDTSVSQLVGQLLREKMEQMKGYRAAMRRDLARAPRVLKRSGKYPTREELHDRPVLRRH
jgi:hypothetical protein